MISCLASCWCNSSRRGSYRLTFYTNGSHSLYKKLQSDKQQTSGSWLHYLARSSKNERSRSLHGQFWNPTVKHTLSFKHGKNNPHAPSENLNVMWGLPQATSFQDSIIDNYIIVIKQLNKFYLSLWRKYSSATIKMNMSLGTTNIFQYFS